jgi:hypothetical protein
VLEALVQPSKNVEDEDLVFDEGACFMRSSVAPRF